MIEIEFDYNQNKILIQSEKNNKFEKAINKYLQKTLINPASLIFLYNGKKIDPAKKIENEMNSIDKQNNKLKVLVNSIEPITPNEKLLTQSEINSNLNQKLKDLERKNVKNEKEINDLKKRNEELEKKLKFYEKPIDEYVERLYNEILGRKSEEGGFLFWTKHLKEKTMTAGQVLKCFFYSDEFKQKTKNEKLNDEDFIIRLYKCGLRRTPNNDEIKNNLEYLKNKGTRENLMDNVINSNEFKAIHTNINLT